MNGARSKVERTVSLIPSFTKREVQVAAYLSEGICAKRIASNMDISVGSARQYIQRVYQKLNVNNKIDAMLTIRSLAAGQETLE